MAYEYTKLNEVTLVESATDPNFLIEENGDIKRISSSNIVTPQIQSDWTETDPTNPAYILNKPESLGGGSGKVVTYYTYNSGLYLNGNQVTAQDVVDEWNAGSILRYSLSDQSETNIHAVSYTTASGSVTGATIKYLGSTGTQVTLSI